MVAVRIVRYLVAIISALIVQVVRSDKNWKDTQISPHTGGTPDMHAGLSGWELATLNSLAFEIAGKKCVKINRPVAVFMKDFISESLKRVPIKAVIKNQEFRRYQSQLKKCFDHVNLESNHPRKTLGAIDPKPVLLETSTLGHSANEQGTSTEIPQPLTKRQLNHAWLDKNGKWHLHWLKSSFSERKKRSIVEDQQDIRSYMDAKNKLSKMLREIYSVVQISCPTEFNPNESFAKILINQTMYWVMQDTHSVNSVALKYFDRDQGSIIDEILACNGELLTEGTRNTTN